MTTVFASCSSYGLGCAIGPRAAAAFLTKVCAEGGQKQTPDWVLPYISGAHTIHRLAKLFHTTLRVDGGGTRIGISRARHLYEAHKSPCNVWLTVDDDVEADEQTLRWLVEAVASDEPRICIAPCLLREQSVVNVLWSPIIVTRGLSSNGLVRRAQHGGFGLVAMNRAALDAVAGYGPKFRDADGALKPAVFVEEYDPVGQLWYGEDLAFFRQLPPRVVVEGLVTGQTVHAGQSLDLRKANT